MPRALIVDDSRTLRMMVGRYLREAGFTTAEAADGQAAYEALAADPDGFDVALVDWNMPVMTGIEMLRLARANGRLDRVPIIMVTTESEMEQMAAALAAGANEYVMKPFTREALLEKIQLAGVAVGA
jgi:two-component system chemotaxis response regulator CheY